MIFLALLLLAALFAVVWFWMETARAAISYALRCRELQKENAALRSAMQAQGVRLFVRVRTIRRPAWRARRPRI